MSGLQETWPPSLFPGVIFGFLCDSVLIPKPKTWLAENASTILRMPTVFG